MSNKAKNHVKDDLESGTESEGSGEDQRATKFLCQSPGFLSAVMRRQVLQEMVRMLPSKVQSRIRALKNIQLDQLKLESEFYQEVYQLEKKYQEKYQPLFDKRQKIVSGEVEPSNEEAKWKEEEEETEMTEKMKDFSLKIQKNLKPNYPEDCKGIPDFWLTIFRSSELLSEMVQEHDEPVFKKLRDIKIIYHENPTSYTLEFHFDKNEYFSNPVLTKTYFLKSTVDEDYPFAFEGPEITQCTGCSINWEKGMNLTVKTIRKKQKHKERGAVRTITKQIPNDSFFNFFNPPQAPEDKDDFDSQGILSTDFEIGHFLRARIIPKAVLYYTGDIVDDDDDYEDEEEEEEESSEESNDEEGNAGKQKTANKKKPTPNECPNQ